MRQVDDIPSPQTLVEIDEILTKFQRRPTFFVIFLAALYPAFKFLILFLHCVTVFSGPCLFTPALTFCHTVAHCGVSKVLQECQSALQTNALFLCLIE